LDTSLQCGQIVGHFLHIVFDYLRLLHAFDSAVGRLSNIYTLNEDAKRESICRPATGTEISIYCSPGQGAMSKLV